MIVNGRELFITSEVTEFISKFEDKLVSTNNKIDQLRAEIERCSAEIDACMVVDILEGTASSKKDLSNVLARKLNLEPQLETELAKLMKIKEIMDKGIEKFLQEADKQLQADLVIFNEVIEKEAYRKLYQLREQQAEILLSLQVAHNEAETRIFSFNQICTVFNLNQYKRDISGQYFHQNLQFPNRNFPEFGAPFINFNQLRGLEEHLMRARADANALANRNTTAETHIQLPPAKTLRDMDLQKFLDSLKAKTEDN